MKCYLERFAVQINLYPVCFDTLCFRGGSLGSVRVSDLNVLWFQARTRFSECIKPQLFVYVCEGQWACQITNCKSCH